MFINLCNYFILLKISSETDPAMALHLTSVILFHTYTQTLLHVPGKCVPQVILFLKSHMEADKYDELHKQQGKLLCYHYLIWILLGNQNYLLHYHPNKVKILTCGITMVTRITYFSTIKIK
jgi:hypothetical protein